MIERYDRTVDGETVRLVHQEDAAQALGLDWVDDHAKFQDPQVPRDSRRLSAYQIAELLGSLQGEGHPIAEFLRRLTFTVLLGDNDAHAKNLAVLHLPGRSMIADVYDAAPNLFEEGRIDCNLALSIDGSFDHRRISAAHLIRQAESWNALRSGEAEQTVTSALADFAKALDDVTVPRGSAGGRYVAACLEPRTAAVRQRYWASGRSDTADDDAVHELRRPPQRLTTNQAQSQSPSSNWTGEVLSVHDIDPARVYWRNK